VITVHDLAFLHWPHFLTEASAAYYGQIDRAARHAAHIIVPSESTKRDLIGQLGVHPTKVSVIPEAADDRFVPLAVEDARAQVMAKYGLPRRYILFVGTIEPRKNVDGLLRAISHLRERYGFEDTGLAIAGGRGWLYEEVIGLVDRLGLGNSTHFLGRVPDPDLHLLYAGAQCHVHAAHYEGFGLPPLEAMACGTPTIVSNVSSLPEVVGDAALLVDPENWEEIAVAVQRVLSDPALHAELREKGLRRARCFSWDMAARQTLQVYRQVVAAGVPASATGLSTPSQPAEPL
jgi:glycosyltransferase involved in cell wall biosynthesis